MATKRYTVDEALEGMFDDDFGLSDGCSSDEEEGDDLYAYLGEPIVLRSDVDALTHDVVSDDDNDDHHGDDSAVDSDPMELSLDEEDPLGMTGTRSEVDESDVHEPSENDSDNSFPGNARARSHTSDTRDKSSSESEVGEEEMGSESSSESSSTRDSPRRTRGGRRGRGTVRGRVPTRGRGRASRVTRPCHTTGATGRGRRGGRTGQGGRTGPGGAGRGRRGSGVDGAEHVVDMTKWKKDESDALCYTYSKTPGPTCQLDSDVTPGELFCRFMTDEVWEHMVTETNRYASENVSHTPRARPWEDVTVPEMKAFVGMVIFMGILRLPRLEMYWQVNHPIIATEGISSIMSRTRFEQIFRFLHLADSSQQVPAGQPGHDKLFKVRPLLDLVLPKFESEYVMHQAVTIDEAMIPFKGRLSFKQYIKNKPTKWGIKAFVLSDATNGYVHRLQIYTGKNAESDSSTGLCTRVVLDLMSGIENIGYNLYTDNYYTSPLLYLQLYEKGINAYGTMRVNRRGFPSELVHKKKDQTRGFYDYRSNGPLLAAVWYDRRFIYFLSTIHRAESTVPTVVKRRRLDGVQEDVHCPPLLPDYQQYMRGVDRGDQLIGCYNVGRRLKKWWKRVWAHVIECCILNAYILEKHAKPLQHALRGRKKRDFLRFRIELAAELIGSFRGRKRSGRRRSTEHDRLVPDLEHWPIQVAKKLECVVCNTRRTKLNLTRSQLRHESRFKCSCCNVHLCIDQERDCFRKYHTLVRYWT